MYRIFGIYQNPNTVTVTLSPSAYNFGLTLGTYNPADTIAISVNAVPFTTVTSTGGHPATLYVGFIDTDPITSLRLTSATSNLEIDMLNFATGSVPVPEPASLVMLCVGALAATALRRCPTA